jgi:hypothetical protein
MALEQTAIIDIIAHDAATDQVVLTMIESRPWSGSDEQLFQLQEKLNAYLSFALDGEMTEAYPQFAGKKLRVELRCAQPPDARTAQLVAAAQRQIAFQEIKLVVVLDEKPEGECGGGCACGN